MQNTCVYVTSHLTHSQHGSGAVIVASRKSGTVIASRNTGNLTCCLVERGAPGGKRGAGSSGRRWCQPCHETETKMSDSDCSRARVKRGQPMQIRELSTAGSTACQQWDLRNNVDSRGADGNSRPAVVRATSATSRDAGNEFSKQRDVSLWSRFKTPRRPPQ